jgi:hypothetical protein
VSVATLNVVIWLVITPFLAVARPPAIRDEVNRTATIDLLSPQSGGTISPNTTVQWSIGIQLDARTRGVAGWSADLAQSTSNPAFFDIPVANTVPSILADFDRPRGIANPLVNGSGGGYSGTQVGVLGTRNLLQIGGAQITFGVSLGNLGTDTVVETGIARSTPVTCASGQFSAPSSTGTYCFHITNIRVNSLESPSGNGSWWVRTPSTTGMNNFCFTVAVIQCDSIDFNNNGAFPEDQDVTDFFAVLAGGSCSPGNTCNDIDFNNNGAFPEDQDVIDFFNVLAGGTCP